MFKMIRKMMKPVMVAGVALGLAGCVGEKVEVGPAELGKIMGPSGYQEQVIPTSKFRLDFCVSQCDKLVLVDISDKAEVEKFDLYMPKDKLLMPFEVGLTIAIDPSEVEQVFNRVPPSSTQMDEVARISFARAYKTYAQRIIRTEARSYMAEYSVMEVANNRDAIGSGLSDHLIEVIEEQTPFTLKFAGLDQVTYPSVIVEAQENAAERREQIEQEKAELEISRVKMNRELEEQRLQRTIDIEQAEAEAEVNRILADSVTPNYELYRKLQALDKISESDNTKFLPVEMMSSLAGQVMVGNESK